MAYKTVYPCWVIDEIEKGNEVYVLDRSTHTVESVNDMTVRRAVGLIEAAEKSENGRYEFWYADYAEKEVENG